jgi:transcriptional regulator with XRE-family HTH domain
MKSTNDFGRYFRRARVEAGVSLRQAATKLGITHVYLGEVERGVRAPLPEKYWERALKAIPTLDREELERTKATSRPLQLSLRARHREYQDLGLMLARRIEKQDLRRDDLEELLRVLRGYEE